MKKYICCSLEDTKKVAEHFSQLAKKGTCFALHGNLGSGKTTFTQYLIKSLNPQIKNVSSPTFTIIQTYPSDIAEIWHIDCYRLDSEDEFCNLGIDEIFSSRITIIEWPEIISGHLPINTTNLKFSKTNHHHLIEQID